jgi:hypothetical protein
MTKRPLSITVISWLFIGAGGVTLLAGLISTADSPATHHIPEHSFEFWLVPAIRILAILCGLFMLYGFNWARWLLVVWVGYHVILSAMHSPFELFVHSLLFTVLLYFVFRSQASAYFRGARVSASDAPRDAR